MGKSVFLAQLKEELERTPKVLVLLFRGPPTELTAKRLQEELVNALVDTCGSEHAKLASELQAWSTRSDPGGALASYLKSRSDLRTLVLLYDELDAYALEPKVGKSWFQSLESTRKKQSTKLKLFAAGGLGTFIATDSPGSPFKSGAGKFLLMPFDKAQLVELAQPFADAGKEMSDQTLDIIRLQSGGNPWLATYALQELWSKTPVADQDVIDLYARFKEVDGGFIARIHSVVANERLSPLPVLLWKAVLVGGGWLAEEHIRQVEQEAREIGARSQPLAQISVDQALDLLAAAGLVRVESSYGVYPLRVAAIPSIVNFAPPRGSSRTVKSSLREQLVADLREILSLLHSMTLDLFERDDVVAERLFSLFIASNLLSRGWASAVRESIVGAGLVDVLAEHGHFAGQKAVVEVKHWPRNNYAGIHKQVESYWSHGVAAGAAIMINANADVSSWKNDYERVCLTGKTKGGCAWQRDVHPLHAHGIAASALASGKIVEIDHFLVHLQHAPTWKKSPKKIPSKNSASKKTKKKSTSKKRASKKRA